SPPLLTSDFCLLPPELTFGEPPPTACRHPVSGSLSLPSSGCFSPFPHGTRALSVTEEYLGLEGGPPIFRQDCSCPALLEDLEETFPYGAVTRSGPPFQTLPVALLKATGLVRVRSPLLAESLLMSFPPATEMFQFARFASSALCIGADDTAVSGGFPHAGIHGSTGARPSPRLIAACYVLPRLSVPRHPPNALKRLILANPKPAPPGEPRIRKACSALVSLFIQSNRPNSDQTPPLAQAASRPPAQTSGTQDRLSADRSTPSPQ